MTYSEPALGSVPMHLRIAESLRTKMDMGELKEGDSLPTRKDLAKAWGVAPTTAQEALAVLQREGRITTGRGRPAQVRKAPKRITLVEGWASQQKENVLAPEHLRGQVGALELTVGVSISETDFKCDYTVIEAPYEMAMELEIQQGAQVLQRRYETVSRTSGHRLAYSLSWIPVALIESNPDLLNEDKEPWPGGHMHQLWTVGIEVVRMVRRVTAVAPSPGVQQRWGMEAETPLLVVRSHSIDTKHRIVEASEAYYPADRSEIGFSEQLPRFDSMTYRKS